MEMPAAARRRPGWVWVIFVAYLVSAGTLVYGVYAVATGRIPSMSAAGLSFSDYAVAGVIAFVNFSGAIALFLLRRAALTLFITGLVLSVAQTLWQAATQGLLQSIGAGGAAGMLVSYLLILMICWYTARLIKRGVLR